jgi:hypothetical protein
MVRPYLKLVRLALLLSLLLPIVVTLCGRAVDVIPMSWNIIIKTLPILLAAALIYAAIHFLIRYGENSIERISRDLAHYIDHIPIGHIDFAILGSAAMSLFLELAVIRWQSEIFPVFAFYKNYSLLACFAGLGLGYALARGETLPLFLSIPLLTTQFALLSALRYGIDESLVELVWRTPVIEQLTMGVHVGGSAPYLIAVYFLLTTVFILTVLSFIPVGQLCGRLMAKRPNLRAYGLNLLGSVLGVILITAVTFSWTPPVVWFSICLSVLLVFQQSSRRILLLGVLSTLVGLTILSWPVRPGIERLHSPYQLLERGPGQKGLALINAAGLYFMRIHDLSFTNANRRDDRTLRSIAEYYELPYRVYGKPAQDVAIVGSGAGNDVAAALRLAAEHVDAIEIDPAILKLGTMYHPEKPYQNPRVATFVNDARTFLRATQKTYDIIVYGLLDSHTVLSHASSVRLDSFVYTVEGLREARQRLKPHGLLSLSFSVLSEKIGRKIYLMMQEAFDGEPPICVRSGYDVSVTFLQTRNGGLAVDEGLLRASGFDNVTDDFANQDIEADMSTDDWPFLYMPKRVYPVSYLLMLGLILVLSAVLTFSFMKAKPAFSSSEFFFLGSGFMLVETKAITELGLTFGNTWQVIGIAICGILFMAFLANCAVMWFRIHRPGLSFMFLVASLLIGFFISKHGCFAPSNTGRINTLIVLTCPMLFSGIVFSSLLSRAKDITGVMAANLLGAMTGGVLEYNSMYFGFRFLYLLAILLYILAIAAFYLGKTSRSL